MLDSCSAPGLTPFEVALEALLSKVKVKQAHESVNIEVACGRVLFDDITSPMAIPAQDNSAMDGYALKAGDVAKSAELKQVAKVFAGHPFNGDVRLGECVRIMTGGQIPKGCNAVVMQENTQVNGDLISITKAPLVGENIRRAGEDIKLNEKILTKGKRLTAVDIGLLASLGLTHVRVFSLLKVAIMSTGDELQSPGQPLQPGQLYESNGHTVGSVLNKLGVTLINFGIVPDDLDELRKAFSQADEVADVVVTSGGVSVGEADYTKTVLDELGKIYFWKLAIKPGKPFAFGYLPNSYFIGLPGNPVSALVTLDQLAVPLLKKISGEVHQARIRLSAVCEKPIKKRPGRMDFQRGIYSVDENGDLIVEPTGAQGSGILTSMSRANCYIVLPQESGSVDGKSRVVIEPFSEWLN